MTLSLPQLPFAADALAPHMSAETFEYHHGKHHQAYVDNGNKLIAGSEFEGKSLEEIVTLPLATMRECSTMPPRSIITIFSGKASSPMAAALPCRAGWKQ